ncbi:MAG: hypothetical protein ACI86H_002958, partial [bacterium]
MGDSLFLILIPAFILLWLCIWGVTIWTYREDRKLLAKRPEQEILPMLEYEQIHLELQHLKKKFNTLLAHERFSYKKEIEEKEKDAQSALLKAKEEQHDYYVACQERLFAWEDYSVVFDKNANFLSLYSGKKRL